MCGFFVYFSKTGKAYNKKKFLTSSDLISHRGPDDNHAFFDKDIAIKFYRLSIRDISNNGRQPMLSWSKNYVIAFNGEIYNAKELSNYLDKNKLKGTSDTEVILNLIEKFGITILSKVEGMFSFVIYDKIKKRCILARDRFGIKPLYMYENNDYLLISSEIKPIINYNKNFEFDNKAFACFFLKQNMDHEEQTFFKKIKSIEPASFLIINKNKYIKKKYWDIVKKGEKLDINTAKRKYLSLLNSAVNSHLVSDRKIGLTFSGGTDSTILASLINSKLNYPLKTYTYDFKNNKYGEKDIASKISKKLKLSNTISLLSHEDVIKELDRMCYTLESPFTSIRLIGVKKVYEKMKQDNVIVAFDGSGGDEILGGYGYNHLYYYLDLFKEDKKNYYNNFSQLFLKNKNSKKILNYLITSTNIGGSVKDCTPFVHINNFNKNFLDKYIDESFYVSKYPKNINFLKKSQLSDINYINLPRSLKYTDRLAMISGIENRVPFLDHKIAEFCFNLPNDLKIKNGETRFLSKLAMKSYLPKKFFTKNKKIITDPQISWLKTKLKDYFLDNISSRNFKENDIYDYKNILNEYNNFVKYGKRTSFDLFQILTSFRFEQTFKKKFKN